MNRKFLTSVLSALTWCFIFLLFVLDGLLFWVVTGPRSISGLTPYAQEALTPPGSPFSTQIGNALLIWGSWAHPLDIRLKDVRFLSVDGAVFARFPDLSVEFDILSLLKGKVALRSVTAQRPSLYLVQGEDKHLYFGFSDTRESSSIPLASFLGVLVGEKNTSSSVPNIGIDRISIENAEIVIADALMQPLLQAHRVQFVFKEDNAAIKGHGSLLLQQVGDPAYLSTQITWLPANQQYKAEAQFANLSSDQVRAFLPQPENLPQVTAFLNGHLAIQGGADILSSLINFRVRSSDGIINFSQHLAEDLAFKEIVIDGTISNNFSTLVLQEARLDFGTPVISAKGSIGREGESIILGLTASLENLPINDLEKYWPTTLAPPAREWVTQNIRDGTVPRAEATLNLKPGEWNLPQWPEEALKASVQVKDANVAYYPAHPVVKNVNGTVYFTAKTMDAQISSGTLLSGTKLHKGNVFINDIVAADTPLKMTFELTAPAADVVTYLDHKDLNFAKPLNLDASRISGEADGTIDLDFIVYKVSPKHKKSDFDGVDIRIIAALKSLAQPGVLGWLDLADVNGSLNITNEELLLKAQGMANGVNAGIDLAHDFTGRQAYNTRFLTIATVPVTQFPKFHYPAFSFLQGEAGVQASVTMKGDHLRQEAKVDLTPAQIDFSTYGWLKPKGTPATLELVAEQEGSNPQQIKSFLLSGGGMEAEGSAIIQSGNETPAALSFKRLRYGNNDLQLTYNQNGGIAKIHMRGESADLTPFLQTSNNLSSDALNNLELELDIKRILAGEQNQINHVRGFLRCGSTICHAADLSGTVGEGKPVSLKLFTDNNVRHCSITTQDAGSFIRGLGIYDNMVGGELTLSGKFDDSRSTHPLEGKLEIGPHTLRKAPLLTKILTIASLSGIVDRLGGKGISFQKLSAPFIYEKDIIYLKDAKSYGDSLGLTAKGTINNAQRKLDIEGTVVPSYTLNSMVGNIPLVGNMLTGGKGQGVFAVQYKVQGAFDDPAITINPLSILTPGILRGFFDIFDRPVQEAPLAEPSPVEKK